MPSKLAKLRLTAFERQQGHCYYCGLPMWLEHPQEVSTVVRVKPRTISGLRCTAEHLVARQDGGLKTESNIVAACQTCNSRRHRAGMPLSPSEYRRKVQTRLKKGKWHPEPVRGLAASIAARLRLASDWAADSVTLLVRDISASGSGAGYDSRSAAARRNRSSA